MAYGLIWAPAARLDLKNLAAYIAEDNPAAKKGTGWFFLSFPFVKSITLSKK